MKPQPSTHPTAGPASAPPATHLRADASWVPHLVPALVPAGEIDATLLRRLAAAMAAQGAPVQVQRMRYDRRYALERLALAHCSPDDTTRRLALRLFDAYQGQCSLPGGGWS